MPAEPLTARRPCARLFAPRFQNRGSRARCSPVWNAAKASRPDGPGSDAAAACADLRGANLNGAILSGACLAGADLRGADLEEAEPVPGWTGGRRLLDYTDLPILRGARYDSFTRWPVGFRAEEWGARLVV